MASEYSKRLQQALAPALKRHDYKKVAATWRKDSSEAVSVFNLQGSQWGPSFYVNLGVYFRALGPAAHPAAHQCHVWNRLDGLVPDGSRLKALLDFDQPIEDALRAAELETLVVGHGLPWLDRLSTPGGARSYIAAGGSEKMLIAGSAQRFLGLAQDP